MKKQPKLRTVEKYKPPFALNAFPRDFALGLGKEIIVHLATRTAPILEGTDWEQIFARLLGAQWKPSNVGLDDIVLGQTAWGAKTVKNKTPSRVSKLRLISGRNSPVYSFGDTEVSNCDPNALGEKVLSIWNERVASIRNKYRHLRTVVLIKADDLKELAVFEFDTVMYDPSQFLWRWNVRGNLDGCAKESREHKFTWQPHGSQFTIVENVPKRRLAIRITRHPSLSHDAVLSAIEFEPSWIELLPSGSTGDP